MGQRKTIFFKNIFLYKVFVFAGLFFCALAVATASSLQLTETEKNWIKTHPVVTFANELDWPPFDYIENNNPAGYSIDVVRLIAKKAGIKAKFVNGYTWKELMQQFKAGKIDVMPAMYINSERKKYALFTKSYYSHPSVMVVHKDSKGINSIKDLNGKRVAGITGFSVTSALENLIPDIKIVRVNNLLEGLKMVSLGKADAFIDSIGTVTYHLENNYIPNVRLISNVDHVALANPNLHMGVGKDKAILRNILDKGLASISRDEKRMLRLRWLHSPDMSNRQSEVKDNIFTKEQKKWLASHSEIRVGIMNAWPPMDYVDSNGTPRGIGVKFIAELNKRLGFRLKIVPGIWKENIVAIKEKRIDAIMDITPRANRKKFLNFTKPYIKVPHLIYTRENAPPRKVLSDLNGETVGLEKGFFIVSTIQNKYPLIKVKEYVTTSDALDALSKGEVDAYVGNRAVANYIIENELISNVTAQGKIMETSSVNAIGVRKDWPILRDILQFGLDDISIAERSRIMKPDVQKDKLHSLKTKLYVKLTKKEREWIKTKPVVQLGVDSAWPPVEWIDDKGIYQGMTSDYIKFISEITGINFKQPDRLAWTDVLAKIKAESIDMIPAVVETPERKKNLNFSKPYLNFPFVIFTRDDAALISGLRDIYGKRVGIEKGYSSQQDLARDHPQLKFVEFKTTKDILEALSGGDIDAYVGNLTVAVYLLNREGLSNIKVAATTDYSFKLSIGIRKSLPELHGIISKTLSLLSDAQRNEIHQKWLKLDFNVGVDYKLVRKMAIIIAVIIFIILAWLIIAERQKKILKLAKLETEKANEKLKEVDQLKSMFIASVSHELRTPLNAVIGFSSVMLNGLYGVLDDRYQDYAIRIHKSGQHLLSLITDIIDISKIESGNLDTSISDFMLDEIINEAVTNLQQLADSKNLKINVNVDEGIMLHTDKRRLFQSILNFVSNAVKYSEEGEITVSAVENQDSVTCTITDTGIGISKDDIGRLFEPFERFESHIKVKAGGTGLGLYLTNKIVTEMLQGKIGAESKLGEGSTFWIKIPKVLKEEIV